MLVKNLRNKDNGELMQLVEDLKAELFMLRFQNKTGQLDKPHKIPQVKKDIAKVFTILNARELKLEQQVTSQKWVVQDKVVKHQATTLATTTQNKPSATTKQNKPSATTKQNKSSATTKQNKPSATTKQNKPSATTKQNKKSTTTKQNKPSATTKQDKSSTTTKQNKPSAITKQNKQSATTQVPAPKEVK